MANTIYKIEVNESGQVMRVEVDGKWVDLRSELTKQGLNGVTSIMPMEFIKTSAGVCYFHSGCQSVKIPCP